MWVASTPFKGRLDKIRKTRMGFLWILHGPQSPRPHGDGTPVRPHKVSYKVSYVMRVGVVLDGRYVGG